MATLGVNIDHIATVREARKTNEPDPTWGAMVAELAGAKCITAHLREDRRHVQDRDMQILKRTVRDKLNMEMAIAPSIVDFACELKPHQATLVPEKREEVTTEGGLDVAGSIDEMTSVTKRLMDEGIDVAMFIDPDEEQIRATVQSGAKFIELHTGTYANALCQAEELARLHEACLYANSCGLRVNAGHGLTYRNVVPIAKLPYMEELNIGHSIMAQAIFTGLEKAVVDMVELIK